MSFAEFGGGSKAKPASSAPTSGNSVGYATSTGGKSGLEVISETLLQYQVRVCVRANKDSILKRGRLQYLFLFGWFTGEFWSTTHPSIRKPLLINSLTSLVLVLILHLIFSKRNVGILEKIVQSLNSRTSSSGDLTVQQYQAQNDVLQQLEEKIRSLLRQQPKQNTAVIKLKRDFERVQLRASQLQESATKKISYIQSNQGASNKYAAAQSSNNPFSNHLSTTDSNDAAILVEQQRLQQLQLEEDRLHEEIMREREEEIRNINTGMHTVNEIYKDLAHIVGQQQEQIDQIENQMEDSRANAESGLQQVEKANEKYGQQCAIQ